MSRIIPIQRLVGIFWVSAWLCGNTLSAEAPEVRIPRITRAPLLEEFLDMAPPPELAGQLARVTGFTQQNPEDGQPASQSTDVYMGYDDEQIYVIFVAFDDDPQQMRAHMSRREDPFGDETVEVQFDTYNDQRRAFSFLTNPFGVQWDAIWTESQGFDGSWDTVWSSRGKLTDSGYVVLMAIPFKSLRFSPELDQTWGLVLVRDIPRNNEVSFWPRVSNRIEGRLNQAATLSGLSGISPGRNIWLIPYATSRRFRLLDPNSGRFGRDNLDPDLGLDAKFVIQDRLALDVTVNPDFSQVESDQPQITVNQRFELFFPERRPFFLENASFFQTPFNLLFTRRIAEPRVGARLSGKLGNQTLGAILIDDESPGKQREAGDPRAGERARFAVLRYSRDISDQSNIGLIYTDRELGDSFNRVGGLDGRLKLGTNWDTRFQWIYGSTRTRAGQRLEDPSFSLQFDRSGRQFGAHFHYEDIGRDFRTESGFVRRTDIRNLHSRVDYTFRPEGARLVSWRPALFAERIDDHDGVRLDWNVNPSIEWNFRRQTYFGLNASTGRTRLRAGDFPGLSVPIDFVTSSQGVFFNTRFYSAVDLRSSLSIGKAINFVPPAGMQPTLADRVGGDLSLTLRPLSRLRIENTFLFTRLDSRERGDRIVSNEILRSRWSWQFNPRVSLRVILQAERTRSNPALSSSESARRLNGDLLLTFLANPWTALYVGYNSNYQNLAPRPGQNPAVVRSGDEFLNDSSQLFVKFSYLFRL